MDKLTKAHYLFAGFASLLMAHLILSQSWAPGGADGYRVLFQMGGFFRKCETWSVGCVEVPVLIDGAVQCALITLPFVALAIYSLVKAFKTSKN